MNQNVAKNNANIEWTIPLYHHTPTPIEYPGSGGGGGGGQDFVACPGRAKIDFRERGVWGKFDTISSGEDITSYGI